MNRADYVDALDEALQLARGDPAPETPEGARLVALAAEIEAYEREQFPIEAPTPAELAAFRRDALLDDAANRGAPQ